MLRALRKSAGTWFVRAFLGLLAILFGIGIWSDPGSMLRSRSGAFLASVGGVDIDAQDFAREYQRDANRARTALGDAFDDDPAIMAQVARATIDRMAMSLQFAAEADRLGLDVSDDFVAKAIVDNPAFHDGTGAFSQEIFAGRIAAQGFNEGSFVALLRSEALRQQIASSVAGSAAPPTALVNRLFSYANEARVADYVVVASAGMTLGREPTEGDLKAYYEAHAPAFTAPEARDGTYLLVGTADLADEVAVDPNEVQALYDERAPSLGTPERRTVEQILLADQAAAEAVIARLDGGEDFAAVATSLGQGGATLSLGAMTRADFFAPALADAAFVTPEGGHSAPAQSPLGWHVFRVTAIEPAHQVTFAEAKTSLEGELKLEKAADAAYELANALEDALAGGAALAEVAAQFELNLAAIPAVAADGTGADGAPVALPAPEILATLFATPEGAVAPLQETAAGGFLIVATGVITPAALRPLDAVRAEADAGWRAAERDALAAAAVADAAIKLAAGTPLADLAAAHGTTVATTQPFRRDPGPADAPFPPELVESLFAANVGDLATAAAADGTGHVLARLTRVDTALTSADAAGLADLTQALREQLQADILEQYRRALQDRYPVELDQAALEALL